jgi:hypothetical protein
MPGGRKFPLIIRNYAVSVAWPDGHHFFHPETFDDLEDARDCEKALNDQYAKAVKSQSLKNKSIPGVHVWSRRPSASALTVRRPRQVRIPEPATKE